MPPRIIVVGSCMMDLVARVETAPERGETVLGRGFIAAPGGKGLNQAVAAARMGAEARLVSRVGGDPFGRQLLDVCDAEGLDRAFVSVDLDAGSGVSLIIVDAAGENRIVATPRANAALTPAHVDAAFDGFAPDAVLMCRETPDPPLIRAARLARQSGARVVLNAAPASPAPPELMALADCVVVNESEAAALTGIEPSGPEEALAAARALAQLGPASAIVTLGAAGAVLLSNGAAARIEPFPSDAIDATGAGDAFCGALAVALCEEFDAAGAARIASAAGALAVRTLGAIASLPRRADVLALAGPPGP